MFILSDLSRLSAEARWSRFEQMCATTRASQTDWLIEVIRRNAESRFGLEHRFTDIKSVRDFQDLVPLRDWAHFKPYDIMAGEENVLTRGLPATMFLMTSGTSGAPKMIPQNKWSQTGENITLALRIHRLRSGHPKAFMGKVFRVFADLRDVWSL